MTSPARRLRHANRHQGEWRTESLDQLLPPEHAARSVWAFAEGLDLTPLLEKIDAVPGRAGAPAFDPRVLLAVWLYATVEGVGSSRDLEDLIQNHLAYRWLAGGLAIGYHTRSDFRTGHGPFLSRLLTETVATLLAAGVVSLTQVAQDGMRVRASAGASSFRRHPTLEKCLEEAGQQVKALENQTAADGGAAARRSRTARERAAGERETRVKEALSVLGDLQKQNAGRAPSRQSEPEKLRASTTDPAARKMTMPDGGYRPAFNAQFATTTGGGAIVGVAVTTEGTDANQMLPMLDQIEERFGARPAEMLVDGGFAVLEAIDEAQAKGTTVYSPVRDAEKQTAAGKDPYARKKGDTDETAEWRARMNTPAAKETDKRRASTAEWVNAQVRNRNRYRVTVRGLAKVETVLLWHAVAHNFGRNVSSQAACPGEGARPAP